jgi:selenide,water dikinase
MARGSALTAEIDASSVPLLPGVETLARDGVRTGASTRNWDSYGDAVTLPAGFPAWRRDLLTDPQTSGGLLIAAAPSSADAILGMARKDGFTSAAIVGRLSPGLARIIVQN